VDDDQLTALKKELAAHEADNPRPRVYRLDGTTEVVEGELLTGLLLPGEADVLEVHDDAIADRKAAN
jgi:hypothetical protein